jgi:hypothetical protein
LVQVDSNNNIYAQIFNNDIVAIEIPRNALLGQLEIVSKNRLQVVDKNSYLASIEMAVVNSKTFSAPPPSTDHKNYVLQNVEMSVPSNKKAAYIELLEKNIDVFSKNENDLGCANHYKHKIDLNNKNPIYVKQF